jgi:hypothetical protein
MERDGADSRIVCAATCRPISTYCDASTPTSTPPHAAGVPADASIRLVPHRHLVEHRVDPARVEPSGPRRDAEVRPARPPRVEPGALEQRAHARQRTVE